MAYSEHIVNMVEHLEEHRKVITSVAGEATAVRIAVVAACCAGFIIPKLRAALAAMAGLS